MMASLTHPSAVFAGNLASKASASDLLLSSGDCICGVPLKALGRVRLGSTSTSRGVIVAAKKLRRRRKQHDYPWSGDIDPNLKGGVLRLLSDFKPLKEKPKPVILNFEKPIVNIQKRIDDIKKMASDTGLDFSDQIIELENKCQQDREKLYKNMEPIQRVSIARHPHRPTFLDHVFNITDKFVELHGDRAGYDDPAIVTGLGMIDGKSFMFIGHQKGRNTKENIRRNFGMPTPHGYRKALRMMLYADHHGFPIVTFIDTPGAYADLKSEEKNQGEAIARNLRTMFGLEVPIISIVIGEGGSGGALAIGCANKMYMLENAVYYVASPEACAAILWKSAKEAPKAAKKLKITAHELCKLDIADLVIPEPLGGAHHDPSWTSDQIKAAILKGMDELCKLDTDELLNHRMLKFRKIGTVNTFREEIPVDPIRKRNMKKIDLPDLVYGMTDVRGLMKEVEKLEEQVLSSSESSSTISQSSREVMIEKLGSDLDDEYLEVAKMLGLHGKIIKLRAEYAEMRMSNDMSGYEAFMGRVINQLKYEFLKKLSQSPRFWVIKSKLGMISKLSKSLDLLEKKSRVAAMKGEINKKYKEIVNRPEFKEKIEALQADIKSSGVSTPAELDQGLKDRIAQLNHEIKSKYEAVLEASGLRVETPSALEVKIYTYQNKVQRFLDDAMKSTDLKDKIELLKAEVSKEGKTPDEVSSNEFKALHQEITQRLLEAFKSSELKDEYEKLQSEISQSVETSKGSNGVLPKGDAKPKPEPKISRESTFGDLIDNWLQGIANLITQGAVRVQG
ncbi:unnamed protein product [Cuscuta epithymum]|uniref:acetyl-CoA carboxytransferase n=1 Tax=Cuscuta epithymum TaxID=186058 RepID=A0AAV0EMY2_9ASTE|nr:unnamed protein product [Cuscuta epithymum]